MVSLMVLTRLLMRLLMRVLRVDRMVLAGAISTGAFPAMRPGDVCRCVRGLGVRSTPSSSSTCSHRDHLSLCLHEASMLQCLKSGETSTMFLQAMQVSHLFTLCMLPGGGSPPRFVMRLSRTEPRMELAMEPLLLLTKLFMP